MKINKELVSVLFLSLILSSSGFSQNRDLAIWYGLKGDHSLGKKIDFEFSALLRTFNKGSKIEQAFLEGGLSYKLYKWLEVAGAYRITENIESNNEYHIRHKWLADIKGSGEIGNFDFSGRFRFQRTDKTYFEDANDKIPNYDGRIKMKATYKTPSFPFNPGISVETFSRMFEATDKTITKYRISLGLEYKINKKNALELEYLFERDFLPTLTEMNIIYLTYSFTL